MHVSRYVHDGYRCYAIYYESVRTQATILQRTILGSYNRYGVCVISREGKLTRRERHDYIGKMLVDVKAFYD